MWCFVWFWFLSSLFSTFGKFIVRSSQRQMLLTAENAAENGKKAKTHMQENNNRNKKWPKETQTRHVSDALLHCVSSSSSHLLPRGKHYGLKGMFITSVFFQSDCSRQRMKDKEDYIYTGCWVSVFCLCRAKHECFHFAPWSICELSLCMYGMMLMYYKWKANTHRHLHLHKYMIHRIYNIAYPLHYSPMNLHPNITRSYLCWYRCFSPLPFISPTEYYTVGYFQAAIQFPIAQIVPKKQSILWKAEVV